MSWNPCIEPKCPSADEINSIETLIVPRARDLGGFEVRRALPAAKRQMVGPFIFFDQMGPAEFVTGGGGIDVRPHPHIGIATVTYLFKGEFQHRDSLGTEQMIYPGEVNWMIAGKAITHSERTSDNTRKSEHALHGVQTWVALPTRHEGTEPAFEHHGQDDLPFIEDNGAKLRLILGNAYGERAPVKTFSEMFYADADLDPWAKIPLPENHEDRGVYITHGSLTIAGDKYESGQLIVFRPGGAMTLCAGEAGARLILLGGEVFPEKRYLWWNFVSSSQEKIEAAKKAWREQDWENGMFKLPPDDNQEFTPAPES